MKAITVAMQKSGELSAEAKALFAKGAAKFGDGLITQSAQIPVIKGIVDEGQAAIKTANALQKAKLSKALSPATNLATSLPGEVAETGKTAKMILDFANAKGIEVPGLKQAVDGLGSL